MNERIEHCLYQSGLTAQGCWDELDDYAKQGIEKFAELIVRECISAVEDTNDRHRRDYFAAKIKQHFGIQE
jgi:hypothetical protein